MASSDQSGGPCLHSLSTSPYFPNEHQFSHYPCFTSSSTNKEYMKYGANSSVFFCNQGNIGNLSNYSVSPYNPDYGYVARIKPDPDALPADKQDLLGHVKPEPYQYHNYGEMSLQPKKRNQRLKKKDQDSPRSIDDRERYLKQGKNTESPTKRQINRFGGLPQEEIMKRFLPDHLSHGLDIIIIGINPGLVAAYKGHHYAGPGNHFWKCLFMAGLIPEPMSAIDDFRLISYGIGFTNIVSRTTKGSADLSRKEIKEGAEILLAKLKKYQPKIAVFNGKMIYEVFSGKKNFGFGRQPDPIPGTGISLFVMPSSSARCSQLPRAVDKVPFYIALKKLRDHLCGLVPDLDFSEVSFPSVKLKGKEDFARVIT